MKKSIQKRLQKVATALLALEKTAGFMKPEIFYGEMWVGQDQRGEDFLYPVEYFTKEQVKAEVGKVRTLGRKKAWWGRYQAPGYLDATDWSGPFASKQACYDYLQEMYGDDEEGEE